MFLSDIENAVRPLTPEQIIAVGVLLVAALAVYLRYFQRIAVHGSKTRPDLLALPEMMTTMVVITLFGSLIVQRLLGGKHEPAKEMANMPLDEMLLSSMAFTALPAIVIIVMLMARGGRVGSIFGLSKVGIFRALGIGFCLAVLALPLTYAAKALTLYFTSSQEAPQALVQKFSSAVSGGDGRLIGLIALSAVVVAPIAEEIVFRGMFYPMLSRGFGRGLAALIAAVFFALVHDTYVDAPGLAVLALCFTLAYEVTGSLLVPIFMHATFNGISLVVMWYQVRAGVGP